MSDILWLTENIRGTTAHISMLERELLKHPDEPGLAINLRSVQKRLRTLESEFAREADKKSLDICAYRIVAPDGRDEYPVALLGAAMAGFQSLISVFVDVAKTGPRTTAHLSRGTAELSSLNFAYTYPGSLGLVLTVPNDRYALLDSELDEAFSKAFDVISAESPAALAAQAKRVGVAPIRKVFEWAQTHAKMNWSADIALKRGEETRKELFVQGEVLQRLTWLIEQTSEITEERLGFDGTLVGINAVDRTFHLQVLGQPDIRGKLAESFAFELAATVPSSVRAALVKRVSVRYAIEKEEKTWELVSISSK